jgi:hypothetical protein
MALVEILGTAISKICIYGDHEFKKVYQHRTKEHRITKGYQEAAFHNIMLSWRNTFCQLLNSHGVHGVRQTEIRTPEPLVPEPRPIR